jgi:hypothetical protein
MSSPSYEYAIAPGDTITVVFEGTTPDLICDYQRIVGAGRTFIATSPAGGPYTSTIYVDDFQYFYKGIL